MSLYALVRPGKTPSDGLWLWFTLWESPHILVWPFFHKPLKVAVVPEAFAPFFFPPSVPLSMNVPVNSQLQIAFTIL